MVRPRSGDFLYSEAEIEVMSEDIKQFGRCDIHGVVIGVLTREGNVDVEKTRKLAEAASGVGLEGEMSQWFNCHCIAF